MSETNDRSPVSSAGGLPAGPASVFVELTTSCNADCPGCQFRRSERFPRRRMEQRHLELLLEQMADASFDIYLQSGEPLLYRPLPWFVDAVAQRVGPHRVHLTSNGHLAPRRELPWELLGSVSFSVDGRDPLASAARGLDRQERAVSQALDEIAKRRGGAALPRITVSGVIRPGHERGLAEYCQYWLERGVDAIELIHLQGTTVQAAEQTRERFPGLDAAPRNLQETDWAGLDLARLDDELAWVRDIDDPRVTIFPDLAGDALIAFYASSTAFVGPARVCAKPWESLEVALDGRLHLSSLCVNLDLGTLDTDGVSGAWKSPRLQEFRALIRREGRIPSCARCCGYFAGAAS